MDLDVRQIGGACHCGTIRFRVRLTNGLRHVSRCNCSYCRMRGAVVVAAELDDLQILAGHDALNTYRFNTLTAKHHFCSRCGVYTHHQRRSNPRQYSVNVACLEGISPFDFDEVPVNEGVRHPSDAEGEGEPPLAGVLRYSRNS